MGRITACISSTVACLVCYFIIMIFWIVFLALQFSATPENIPIPFSIPFGSDMRIDYQDSPCSSIEIDTVDPVYEFTVYLTIEDEVQARESVEQVLVNATFGVGRNSGQLSYYGVPVVARGDEVSLSVRAIDQASAPQSVDISVYDLDGFSQLNANSATNPKFIYNLDRSCLLSATGCVASPTVESEGWVYFVFESEPTPSSLLVSLSATVRKYDLDQSVSRGQCTLNSYSKQCRLLTPKETYRVKYQPVTDYIPFSLTYKPLTRLPASTLPLQAINTSTELTWTCIRADTWSNTVVLSIFSVLFGFMSILGVVVIVSFCCDRYIPQSTRTSCLKSHCTKSASSKREMQPPEYSNVESLPPSYDNATANKV